MFGGSFMKKELKENVQPADNICDVRENIMVTSSLIKILQFCMSSPDYINALDCELLCTIIDEKMRILDENFAKIEESLSV